MLLRPSDRRQGAWIWASSGRLPTALIAWTSVMSLLLYLFSVHVSSFMIDAPFHAHEFWFQVPPGDLFSLQKAIMLTQVLWLIFLWTKFREARSLDRRMPWQQYLFYAGLALVLLGQQQVLYKMSVEVPHYEIVVFPEYTGAIPDPTPDEPEPFGLDR